MSKTRGEIAVEFLRGFFANGGVIARANFSSGIRELSAPNEPVYALTLEKGGLSTLQMLPWSPELEEFLLEERPTRMATQDEEIERLANVVSNNLRSAEDSVGKDFAQAVFIEVISKQPEFDLVDVLARVAVTPASKSSVSYATCSDFLRHSIHGLRNAAVLFLRYPDDQSTSKMMGKAVAIVLDDRFHISLRDSLFPKSW